MVALAGAAAAGATLMLRPYLDDGDVQLYAGVRPKKGPRPTPIADRFWPKVARSNGCWEWTAGCYPNGYGKIGGRLAHRVAWELERGIIPPPWLVLHKCDNKRCVRPDHLYLGNKRQNLRDAKERGLYRQPSRHPLTGERHPGAKLTMDAVDRIRRSYRDGALQQELADAHGVSQATISLIVRGLRWR